MAEGLLHLEHSSTRSAATQRVDVAAIERARQFLDAERTRVVHSQELEAATGLTRYGLARQRKRLLGTSPYRYLTLRKSPTGQTATPVGFSILVEQTS